MDLMLVARINFSMTYEQLMEATNKKSFKPEIKSK